MSFHHCIRNGIALAKFLLHPLNHISKHPIVVQITQDSHYFPTQENKIAHSNHVVRIKK
jgi:hypothetical protein